MVWNFSRTVANTLCKQAMLIESIEHVGEGYYIFCGLGASTGGCSHLQRVSLIVPLLRSSFKKKPVRLSLSYDYKESGNLSDHV
jgi:hypothetical protein